ncbi:MAG: 6-carboxytetrahydropterin synthase [Candidatus Latescibacteria bacterium]|nr:6-carboxytetrahydropterin synthase [Candidatus Latescibacterota bacterium]
METIRAKAEFHAAHRQLGYDGKCVHVHGHTWRGQFVVRAKHLPRSRTLDMTVDFGALKDIFKFLDHKMLVSEEDELFLNPEIFGPKGVVVVPGKNPSVENVAVYCMSEAIDLLAKLYLGQDVTYTIEVTIQETDNNVFTLERTVTL